MRSVVHRLPPKDKTALAHFYETDGYKALIKLMKMMKANSATHCLTAPDFETVRHLQGQEFSLKELEKLLEEVYKTEQKH